VLLLALFLWPPSLSRGDKSEKWGESIKCKSQIWFVKHLLNHENERESPKCRPACNFPPKENDGREKGKPRRKEGLQMKTTAHGTGLNRGCRASRAAKYATL